MDALRGPRTRQWSLITGLGCRLILVDESAQDRSTPDPAEDRSGTSDVGPGGRNHQPEHLTEDQVQQPQRHAGIMSDQRLPLVSDPGPTYGTPHPPPTSRTLRLR